jgi:hypothetical protein
MIAGIVKTRAGPPADRPAPPFPGTQNLHLQFRDQMTKLFIVDPAVRPATTRIAGVCRFCSV